MQGLLTCVCESTCSILSGFSSRRSRTVTTSKCNSFLRPRTQVESCSAAGTVDRHSWTAAEDCIKSQQADNTGACRVFRRSSSIGPLSGAVASSKLVKSCGLIRSNWLYDWTLLDASSEFEGLQSCLILRKRAYGSTCRLGHCGCQSSTMTLGAVKPRQRNAQNAKVSGDV